jgi:hypothetical protein
VNRYATSGDGTAASPWSGWEAAFVEIPEDGARIVFPGGAYAKTAAIELPVNLTGWLDIRGERGSVVTLSAAAPRMFDIARAADYDTLRRLRVEHLTIDAADLGGNNHVLLGNAKAGVVSSRRRLNYADIEIRDVRMVRVSDDGPRTGIQLNTQHATGGETPTFARDILIENVRQEGGASGIVLTAAADDGAKDVRHTFERITIRSCSHDRRSVPRAGGTGAHIQIGAYGHVRSSTISDCRGRNSVDVGIEVDNPEDVVVEGSTVTDAWYSAFLVTNYNPVVDPARNGIVFDRCAAIVRSASTSSVALRGFATYTSSRAAPLVRSVSIVNSRYENRDSRAHRPVDAQTDSQEVRVENFEVRGEGEGPFRAEKRPNRPPG